MLRERAGRSRSAASPHVALERRAAARAVAAGEAVGARWRELVGEQDVRQDRAALVCHAAGRSYPDLVRLRAGDGSSGAGRRGLAREPRTRCAAALAACADAERGRGAVRRRHERRRRRRAAARRLRSRDLARPARAWTRLVDVDERSLTRDLRAGHARPARSSALLAGRGLTLGHFPQSFEYATVGGWVATRSAGQASTGYGRIDELVRGLTLRGAGRRAWRSRCAPASAAGPDLRELVVGSEGTLGVITEATLRVRPLPAPAPLRGLVVPRRSRRAPRRCARSSRRDASPDVARLSDEEETRLTMALASSGVAAERLGRRYLRARGHERGCSRSSAGRATADERRAPPRPHRRSCCAPRRRVALGTRPGRAWQRGRFAAPYLRDDLLDRGVMVETLETATTWTQPARALRRRRRRPARRADGPRHAARSSSATSPTSTRRAPRCTSPSSPARRQGDELDQWRAAKTAACDAIVAARRHDHPPPRGRPRPRALDARRGRRARASRCCGPSRSRARPDRDHEPRQAAAGLA